MTQHKEEYTALIEALQQGPNPSSFQEVTGARVDLFTAVHNIEVSEATPQPSELTRVFGYAGAVVFVAAMTPDSRLEGEDKLVIVQAAAEHIDEIPAGNGRSTSLRIIRGVERGLLKRRARNSYSEQLRSDAFDLYMRARRHVARKPIGQLAIEKMDHAIKTQPIINVEANVIMDVIRKEFDSNHDFSAR